jgi:PAS domain S-box-containing protein
MENSTYSLISFKNFTESIIKNKHLMPEDKNEIIQKLHFIQDQLENINKCDFKKIADEFHDGIFITDEEGKILYVNKAYLEMAGLGENEIIDKNINVLIENGTFHNAVTPEVIKHKKVINSIGKAKNGVDMLITGKPIFSSSGSLERVLVTQRNNRQLRHIQKELEISQKKITIAENITKKKKQEIEHLIKQQLNTNFIGISKEMKEVKELINKAAPLDITVLITGESGVGKEVVANEIFRNSQRNKAPFIKVNCAAIPENLLETELFGYEKGAFTGAITTKLGLFELANQGTLLLDEIGDMPLSLQVKLLRAIQQKQIIRIGGRKVIDLDVRIIAATNANLKELVKAGRFREDLYYRINIFPINILPLRSRTSDVIKLTEHFLEIYNGKYNKKVMLEERAISMLKEYSWPGNIRELQNVLERIVIISEASASVDVEKIASLLMINMDINIPVKSDKGLKEIIENIERELIKKTLKETGSTRKAAKVLKISQSSVVKKLKKLGIDIVDY